MSEIDQLKKRIDDSGSAGIETAVIRDDYDPVGNMMIKDLTSSGHYITRKVPPSSWDQKWRIFKKEFDPFK